MGKQTTIEAPANRHSYKHGLDETLKRQQLADLLKINPNIKVNIKNRGNLGFSDLPLFLKETQTKLF